MNYETLKAMGKALREDVANYCRGTLPTLDEAESLAYLLGAKYGNSFGKCSKNLPDFEKFIRNSVKAEILRTCA